MPTTKSQRALLNVITCLFMTIISVPVIAMGFILRQVSGFAVEIMVYGALIFVIGIILMIVSYRKWKALRARGQ